MEKTTSPDYYDLYSRNVDEIKPTGKEQFVGLCPFHDDNNRSFSFETKDGLSNCFAGCGQWNAYTFAKARGIDPEPYRNGDIPHGEKNLRPIPKKERNGEYGENTDKILSASDKKRAFSFHRNLLENFKELTKGLTWNIEAIKKTFTGYDPETKRFTFLHSDINGKGVNVKHHKDEAGNMPYSIKGHGACRLYPLHLLKDYDHNLPLIFCEGEKDVITLLSLGFNAVTSTTGAENHPKDLTPLKKFKNITIVYDHDKAGTVGSVKPAKALKKQSPQSRIAISSWGKDAPVKWDITDHFSQDKEISELLEDFDEILGAGKEYQLPKHEQLAPTRKTNAQYTTFDPSTEADFFKQDKYIIFHNETLKQYSNGFYKSCGDRHFLSLLTEQLEIFNSRQAKVKETLEVLKNSLSDPVLQEQINPDPYFINCKNGIYDTKNDKLKPHTPEYVSTFQINANYNTDAKCPRFEEFLDEVLIDDNGNPDENLKSIVQEFAGYSLFASIPYHRALIFYGEGSNGKSVLVEVLEYLLRGHTSNVHFEIVGTDMFSTADLSGSLLNISAEIGARAYLKDNTIKQIISGDTIRAQRKNQNAFDFRPVAKHILTANNLPYSADKSYAFFRRFMIIPFNQRFLPLKEIEQQQYEVQEILKIEDPHLTEKLINETDGIFIWALAGLKRLLSNRSFTDSEQVRKLGEVFKIRSSSVETFIDELTEFSSIDQILFSDAFKRYCDFCKYYKIPALTNRKFSNELKNQGLIVEKGTDNKTFIKGITWK